MNSNGQALVEYLLLVVFLIILGSKLITGFTEFMRDSVGGLSHVLGLNLSVGMCETDCFYTEYRNGFRR